VRSSRSARPFAIVAIVEVVQHGRIARDLAQQRFEVAQRVISEQLDLLQYQG
jgi:hypothetical protein